MTTEQDPFRESSGAYVLDALDATERRAFEAHLAECDGCTAEVRALREVAGALPYGLTQVDTPASLRERVLAAAAETRKPSSVVPFESHRNDSPRTQPPKARPALWVGWMSAAAGILVAAGVGMYAAQLATRLDDTQRRLADAVTRLQEAEERLQAATRETTTVRASLALLTAPDLADLRLAGQAPAPNARARAFLSRSRGLLFAATNLPAIPNDRTYQVWFLTPGAPVSAGLLRPDAQGNATVAFDVAASVPNPTGIAVSLEPDGGVPAPTGAIYLVTQ
jgi:anti-sigma-K factor RskA